MAGGVGGGARARVRGKKRETGCVPKDRDQRRASLAFDPHNRLIRSFRAPPIMSSDKSKRTSRGHSSGSGDKKRARSTTGAGGKGGKSARSASAGAKKRKATPAADRSGGSKAKQHKTGDKPKAVRRVKAAGDVAPKVKKVKIVVDSVGEGAAAGGAAGGAAEGKQPKLSARKIQVNWKPRVEYGVRTQPYRRILNFYAQQKLPEMRMASGVAKALQSAVEEEVVEILRRASVCAVHAKRNTVNSDDINLQAKLVTSKSGDSEDLMAWANKKMSKRAKSKPKKAPKAKPSNDGADAAPGEAKPKTKKPRKAKGAAAATAAPAGDGAAAAAAPADLATMPPMVPPIGA